jgi:leucyl aminopeptidase (aminopeptidase T)
MNQRRLAERVAYKLIQHTCRLQAGDAALLFGRRDQLDLLLDLEFQALAVGARALIVIEDEQRLRRLLSEASPPNAANERLSLLPTAQSATHVVHLNAFPPDLHNLPQETLHAWNDANNTLRAALRLRQRARIDVALPSPRLAQRLRQPFHPYNDAIWQALDCDYQLMKQRGQRLQAALSGASLLRLSDPRGAELTVRLATSTLSRRADGILSPDARVEADECANMLMPAGEFCVGVAEGSAKGEAIIDAAWLQGQPLRHLRVRFHQGRIADMEGAGLAQAEAILAADAEAALLRQLSIGFNPAVTALRSYPLGTEASLLAYRRTGAVFLKLGEQQTSQGTTCSTAAWSLGLAHAMLEVDGQVLLRGGAFVAD